MSVSRRTVLAGLGTFAAIPAWAQAIAPQSDPWAQVDPYADPRNGFPGEHSASGATAAPPRAGFSAPRQDVPISREQEIQLGKAGYPGRIRRGGGAYPDGKVQKALQDFFAPMAAVADRSDLPWQITLVNDKSPNASAGLGGTVIVNAGLLAICDRAGELAATLAHEIGHVDKYHQVRMAPVRELIATITAGGDKGDLGGNLPALLPNSGGVDSIWEVFSVSYTREHEAEADAHEMVILERLGVDPVHAVNDQWNFAQLGDSDINELVRSHPRNDSRMDHIKHLAALQRRPEKDFVFPGWDVLKAAFPTTPRFKKA